MQTINGPNFVEAAASDAVPAISIIVPCRNEVREIETCLRSILAQEPVPDGRQFEVIVADGMSDDGTREILERFAANNSMIHIIDNPGRIASTGLNAAIRAARGDVILRVDAHTEYAPDYIRQCIAVLEETGADNVGGPVLTRANGYVSSAICAAYHSFFSVGGAGFHNPRREGELDTIPYGCWRKSVLLKIGLFDESLVRNQDDELNFRLLRNGGRLWQSPRIRSWYRPRSSLKALFIQYFQYGYWKVPVIARYRRPASLRHVVPVCFILAILLGWLPALIDARWWLVYGGTISLYALLNVLYSVWAAAAHDWRVLPLLPVVFMVFHFSYGIGFAGGVVDFLIFRRRVSPLMQRLSRPKETAKGSGER